MQLPQDQLAKAVASLLKFVGRQKEKSKQLLDDEEFIYVNIALKKTPSDKRRNKPKCIPIPHPLVTREGAEICLFVKDHDGSGQKEVKQRLEKLEKNGGVSKVIGVKKLKTKYESFEAKRELSKAYGLFLADDRILNILPKLIGKSFFKKKKQPVPIDLSRKDWAAEIRKACECTFLFLSGGSCLSIKVAKSSFTAEEVVENVNVVMEAVVQYIPKQWKNIQGVFLKTADSVALPVYQVLPDPATKVV